MTEVGTSLDAVGQLIHGIPDLAAPPEVEVGLRAIFRDPSLELFWWDWEHERYVDVHWRPHDLRPTDDRVLTMIEYPSRKVGAIIHAPRVLEEPEFEPMLGAMRIAMERDRLHRELVEKLDQLQASRQRLVKAARKVVVRGTRTPGHRVQGRAARLIICATSRNTGAARMARDWRR